MRKFKQILELALCLMMLLSLIACGKQGKTPNTTETTTEDPKAKEIHLYVSPSGADTNNGSESAPFATLQAALAAAGSQTGEERIVINLRAGTYMPTETITLGKEDSNLTIRAYPGETVTYTGAVSLPYGSFAEVTDQTVLNRIISTSARKQVKVLNLKSFGVTDLGEMKVNGKITSTEAGYSSTLTYNGELMQIAQYPNGSGFLSTGEIIKSGSGEEEVMDGLVPATYKLKDTDRYKKWLKADDIWALSYICTGDADVTGPATVTAQGEITTLTTSRYTATSDKSVKFLHLLEEIDEPGEWYLDYNTGDLYVYAPEGMKAEDTFEFNAYNQTFFVIDGAEDITVENITFSGTRTGMFEIKNSKGIVFDACDISNAGDYAIRFEQCSDSGVKNSYIHDLAAYGIMFYQCGDKATLTAGNCFVENCEIARFSQQKRTGTTALYFMEDVGNVIANNKIHTSPHNAIEFASNDLIIEYNEIYNISYEVVDSAAIYASGYYNTWGNEIRYNYFHDLTNEKSSGNMCIHAVYFDDLFSAANIHGNVFLRCDSAVYINGGRSTTVENNVMLSCPRFVEITQSGVSMGTDKAMKNSDKVDWHTDVWKTKYPGLEEFYNEGSFAKGMPKYNVIRNNIRYNSTTFTRSQYAIEFGTAENNYDIWFQGQDTYDLFIENIYAKIETFLPEFEAIPFEKIGLGK